MTLLSSVNPIFLGLKCYRIDFVVVIVVIAVVFIGDLRPRVEFVLGN